MVFLEDAFSGVFPYQSDAVESQKPVCTSHGSALARPEGLSGGVYGLVCGYNAGEKRVSAHDLSVECPFVPQRTECYRRPLVSSRQVCRTTGERSLVRCASLCWVCLPLEQGCPLDESNVDRFLKIRKTLGWIL